MVDVVLSLGSNLGDRALHMQRMEGELGLLLTTPMVRSALMETEPIDTASSQQWFYNRIIRGGYAGTPRELLKACLSIEDELGRKRSAVERYAERTADIDILLFGEEVINEPHLVVPHPEIQKRRFCILGLNEVAGACVFPGSAKRITELAVEWEKGVLWQKVRVASKEGKPKI